MCHTGGFFRIEFSEWDGFLILQFLQVQEKRLGPGPEGRRDLRLFQGAEVASEIWVRTMENVPQGLKPTFIFSYLRHATQRVPRSCPKKETIFRGWCKLLIPREKLLWGELRSIPTGRRSFVQCRPRTALRLSWAIFAFSLRENGCRLFHPSRSAKPVDDCYKTLQIPCLNEFFRSL